MTYGKRLSGLLTAQERHLFERLDTPQKVQDYLDTLPLNFERQVETYMSPRRMLREKTAHCFEGALFAAAVLAYHGQKPLLLDLQAALGDDDHVVTLYRQAGRWGAISKTNHAMLRYRDPVYESVRELAMSFFHEYYDDFGRKTMRAFSAPFDLSKYRPEQWVTIGHDLVWLVNALDASRHFPIAPKKNVRLLRKASKTERRTLKTREWKAQGKRS